MFPSREYIDSAQGGTLQKLLSYNSELDSSLNLAVKLCNSLELTKCLNRVYSDVLAVYLDALLLKCSSKVSSCYSTKDLLLLCLSSDSEVKVVDCLSQSLCVSKDLSVLVSALTKVLSEYLLCRSSSSLSEALRNQVVVGIAGANVNDVVCVAQVLYVFDKNYLHGLSSSLLFHTIGYEWKDCEVASTLNCLSNLLLILL